MNGERFYWPQDEAVIAARYWRPARLAAAWGCSDRTARRWMQNNPNYVVELELMMAGGKVKYLKVVNAGQERIKASIGNPYFLDSGFQREMAQRRIAKQQRKKDRAAADGVPWED